MVITCQFFFRTNWSRGSEPDDDQGGVVGGAGGRGQVEQERVGHGLGREREMCAQRVGEAGQADIDVFAPTFDQAVGVQDEGVSLGEILLGLWACSVFGAGTEWRIRGLVQEHHSAVGTQERGRGVVSGDGAGTGAGAVMAGGKYAAGRVYAPSFWKIFVTSPSLM